ncbi:MAG: PKD domain-containing protein, partial [Planctomycetota bacterium]
SDGLALKPGDWFGFCSANLGDFDGDGVNDVAVGSVLDDDGGVNQGSLWLLMLNADGSVKSSHEIDELEGGFGPLDDIDQFGTSVANIGDLDGDGVTDITVGAVKDDDGGTPGDPDSDVGALYVFFLQSDKTVKSWVKISDESGDLPYSLDKWDWFGSATARLGGSSGDGVYNVAAGCRNDDDSGPNRGAIYLLQLNDGTFPVADFSADRTLGVAPLTVQFSDASGGDTTSWVWNFSDGPQSTQQSPQKTFAATGSYDISLTARGPSGADTLVRAGHITVVAGPLAGFDATPRQGDCPLAVQFEDLSQGVVTSWNWDFGDGTSSSAPAPAHVYAECGSYDVTLTVNGPSGTHVLSEPGFVVAALFPPVADFALAPSSGVAPLEVQFSDLSSGPITSWSWDFGDGAGTSVAAPLHTYTAPGAFEVSLTVTGPGGSDTKTLASAVLATVPPPDADFDAAPTTGIEPLAVTFTDQTTGSVSSWSWDFGDGTGAAGSSPLHVYENPGLYTVTLTASGPGGSNARVKNDLVTVVAAPPGADFSAATRSGEAPLLVQFQDESALSVSAWSWDFGDGTGSDAQHPAHLY